MAKNKVSKNVPVANAEGLPEVDQSLMDDLMGTGAKPLGPSTPEEAQELKQAAEDAKTNPLVLDPLPTKSVAKAPARGFSVTVEGLYLKPSTEIPGKRMKEKYSINVVLQTMDCALSVIKNKLLDRMLKVKYPGAISYLTHEITNVKPLSDDTPVPNNVAYMGLPKLRALVQDREMPVDLEFYGDDLKNLRAAVTDFILNPVGFKEREGKRMEEVKSDRELLKLNPELAADGPDGITKGHGE